MIGFAELLLSEKPGALNAKQRDFLSDVYQGGKQLLSLTDELLRFARLSQQPLLKQLVNMETLVWEILRAMQHAAAPRDVDLCVGPLPNALADPALLRQVLVNLLSNAFKFTQHVSHPRIEVSSFAGSGAVTYQISDNGAGFDMIDAPRLFGIFQRLHSQTAFAGTGVGLSVAKRIVERHGGTLSAHGEIGKGATFAFALPAETA
jgi:signal transduction histidine kinase